MPAKTDADVLRPGFERTDARGTFVELLNAGRWESLVWGEMTPGAVMGNHYHKDTEVCLFLTHGRATVVCEDVRSGARRQVSLKAREGILFRPHEAHAVRYEEPSAFLMLKSRRYDPAHPDTFPRVVLE